MGRETLDKMGSGTHWQDTHTQGRGRLNWVFLLFLLLSSTHSGLTVPVVFVGHIFFFFFNFIFHHLSAHWGYGSLEMVSFSPSLFPARCLLLKEAPQWDTDGQRSIFLEAAGAGVCGLTTTTQSGSYVFAFTQPHLLYWCRVSIKAGVFRMRVYIVIDLNRLWFLSLHPLFFFPSLLLGLSSLYSWPKVNITCSNMPSVYLQKIRVRQIIVGQGFLFLKHVPGLLCTSAHSPSIPETLEKWKRTEDAPPGTVVVGMGGNHLGLSKKKPKINQGFCYVLFLFYYGAHGSNNTFIKGEGKPKTSLVHISWLYFPCGGRHLGISHGDKYGVLNNLEVCPGTRSAHARPAAQVAPKIYPHSFSSLFSFLSIFLLGTATTMLSISDPSMRPSVRPSTMYNIGGSWHFSSFFFYLAQPYPCSRPGYSSVGSR